MGSLHPIVIAITLITIVACVLGDLLPPSDLKVEYLTNPWGIDSPHPRFSWTLSAANDDRALQQSAYRISLKGPSGSWDSGLVASNRTQLQPYTGPALTSDTTYTWNVLWQDAHGRQSPWSVSGIFHTALLSPGEWVGSWIGGANQLRTEFDVNGPVDHATVFISGLGYYELFLNGEKAGLNKLDPGWTTYESRVLYVSLDVTYLVKQGRNAMGVMLGNGWYVRDGHGPRSLLAQLHVMYSNGTRAVLCSTQPGDAWRVHQGPITADDIYNGESYDARLETPGWTQAGFIDSQWSPATTVPAPNGTLSSQMMPAVRVIDARMVPKNSTEAEKGTYVFDFGQNFSGWVSITIPACPSGTTITLRHAEILRADGSGMIYTDNLRSAKATDTYTCSGAPGGETYTPRFTYHGFRYVELTGYPGTPTLSTLMGELVHSAVDTAGQISFSVPLLNEIQHNVFWGQRTNLMSVPTDCDQRDERKGWMGDAQLTATEALHNFDMGAFYTNFLRQIRDIQDAQGTVTDTVPHTFGNRPADPSWGSAYPILVYETWRHNGDDDLLRSHYPNLLLYMQFLAKQAAATGLQKLYAYYGDWVPPPPAQKVNDNYCSAFSYIQNLQQVLEMAMYLNDNTNAQWLKGLLTSALNDFNSAWFNGKDGAYEPGGGMQTAQSLALSIGAPQSPADAAAVMQALVTDIQQHGNFLTTGIIGTKYIMEALTENGRADVALTLAENTDYPSWGYMIRNTIEPATTLWELWDAPKEGPGMNSRNHIMYGSVGAWFYTALAGIRQAPGSTGFDSIIIAPQMMGDLSSVSASVDTVRGPVTVQWSQTSRPCGTVTESETLLLQCADGSAISNVTFASFGTATGVCGAFAINPSCHSAVSMDVVRELCVGQTGCSISATDTNFGDPCFGTLKHLSVSAVCAPQPVTLATSIPVGAEAAVRIPVSDASVGVLRESGTVLWSHGSPQPITVPGVVAVDAVAGALQVTVLSGTYHFVLTEN